MNDVKAKYCFYCERPFGEINARCLLKTKDHIIPMSKGGRQAFAANILYCCHKCNKLKGDMMPEEFANWLLMKIADIKNDTQNKRMLIKILDNVRKLILKIAPIRHKMIRILKPPAEFKPEISKTESRPSTPLWWSGLNEK